MVRQSKPDPEVVHSLGALLLVVKGLEVRSRGLVLLDHPEIAAKVSQQSLLGGARALLLRLVAHVVHGRGRLIGGMELEIASHRLRLERRSDSELEIWELDDAGEFVNDVSRTARQLS